MARAYNQAQKFGAEMAMPDEVSALTAPDGAAAHFVLQLRDGERVTTRSVVVASGARYRRLAIANLHEFESSSVHYWASPLEAKLCAQQDVALVGAGNSAGQAAVYLASQGAKVWMLVRGPNLVATMSRYLVDRIESLPNIEVVTGAQVSALEGSNGILQTVRWRLAATGQEVRQPIHHLFLFIGAEPNTDWLAGSGVALDAKRFVLTGTDACTGARHHPLETSRPGVFAIGDVRAAPSKPRAPAGAAGPAGLRAPRSSLGPTPRH